MNATTYDASPALVRLFGDEFEFYIRPGATEVGVILRNELIMTIYTGTLYPGWSLELKIGGRTWKFRIPRWSITLRLEQIE